MSVAICSPRHLLAIIDYGALHSAHFFEPRAHATITVGSSRQSCYTALLQANTDAFNERYKEQPDAILIPNPFPPRVDSELSAVEALKLCRGYEYQCEDMSNYDMTRAARIIRAVMDVAIPLLPGYVPAKWAI